MFAACWWRARLLWQFGAIPLPNVVEDPGDHLGVFDAGNHPELAAAHRARLDVDGEYAFQSLRPGHGSEGFVRLLLVGFAFWYDGLAVLAVRGEYAVETGEVEPWTRNQGREARDEVHWIEDDMGGAVPERLFESVDHLSPVVQREPLVGNGGSGDVAAEFLEPVALVGLAAGCGMEGEAGLPGEQG